MIDDVLVILALLAFPLLWHLLKRCPKWFANYLARYGDWSKYTDQADFSRPQVFSAETVNGGEAEFVDYQIPKERSVIRMLRAILVSLYLIGAAYFFLARG